MINTGMTKPSQDWLAQHSYPYEKFVEVWQSYVDKIVVQLNQDGMKCDALLEEFNVQYNRVQFKLRIQSDHKSFHIGTEVRIVIPYDQFPNDPNCYPCGYFKATSDTWDGLYFTEEHLIDFNNTDVAKQLYELVFITVTQSKNDNYTKYMRQLDNLRKYYHSYLVTIKNGDYGKTRYLEMKSFVAGTSRYNEFFTKLTESVGKLIK